MNASHGKTTLVEGFLRLLRDADKAGQALVHISCALGCEWEAREVIDSLCRAERINFAGSEADIGRGSDSGGSATASSHAPDPDWHRMSLGMEGRWKAAERKWIEAEERLARLTGEADDGFLGDGVGFGPDVWPGGQP